MTKKSADKPAEPLRVAIVPPSPDEGAFVAGDALTPGQKAGLDPIDPELDAEQAKDRAHRTNMQTDHEMENGLDPVSGGPSPAIMADTPLTARAVGAPPSDANGRPALSQSDQDIAPRLRDALRDARTDDKRDGKEKARQGWRTPQEMGIPGAVVKRIMEAGAPLESETVPNGAHFPETGTRYRLK